MTLGMDLIDISVVQLVKYFELGVTREQLAHYDGRDVRDDVQHDAQSVLVLVFVILARLTKIPWRTPVKFR